MLNAKEKLNLPAVEEKVLAFWKERDIFKKSLEAREGGPEFVFYEGPPTANARPGTHHMIGRAMKDIIPRYKQMCGYHVPRRAGWDTHGLPVEIEVEKELGIKSKPEIETYGIAAFNAKAKASVWKYKEEWERLTERVGFWLDMEKPYITYDNVYVEKLWGVLKKVNERGLLYKGHKVVPWCTRCGTALSSHELAQGYKEVTDTSAYVSFKITSGAHAGEYIVAWTTTPWTLLGNVALAVNPAHTFVTVPDADRVFVLEKSAALRMKLPIDKEFPASELVGAGYEALFDVPALTSETSHKVYVADFVTNDSGTGVVHTAVMYGEDDYVLGAVVGLPMVHTVDEAGNFTDGVPAEFIGLRAKNATTEEKIIAYIKEADRLLMTEPYKHDYPFCWRCQTPVLYYATDAWFIAMSKLRTELHAANAGVNWTPAHIKDGRFGEWVDNVKDWALSRARYWGTPLPVWECTPCGTYKVVGSLAELPEQPLDAADNIDVHRPFIDAITIPCEKCGGAMARVKDVLDVWFDSGAMPFASEEFSTRGLLPVRYPADYICEAIDQTRGWFYTLMAVGVLMEQGSPYKNVTCYGHLLDKLGKKMSKSKGNGVDPWELLNTHGADAVRWHFYSSAIVKEAQKFNERDFGKGARAFISLIYNSFVFLETYGGGLLTTHSPLSTSHVLDRWVISRLHETAQDVAACLDVYEVAEATQALESFADDLSRWYLRRSRKRAEALPVLRYVLLETSKLVAPFMPFFAEALYKSLGGEKESVHMEDWFAPHGVVVGEELALAMAEVRRVASLALASRAEEKLKVRQPLASLTVKSLALQGKAELLSILADEVNVKEIIFNEKLEKEIALDTVITPELEREGIYRDLVRMAQGLRQSAGCAPHDAVTLHIEAGDNAHAALEELRAEFVKDVNAKEVLFTRTDEFTAEAIEKIAGASVWMGLVR
ncbi:MAG: isoleucine--tRNA ligase [bacterium]|nr:isoleucine--tRNA ligase [bacterium]